MLTTLLSLLWAPWSSWNARRLDGPLLPSSGSVDFGFIQGARVCENSTDLRASGISLLQGTLEECASAVAGRGITDGLCASRGYFQFRDQPGGGCHRICGTPQDAGRQALLKPREPARGCWPLDPRDLKGMLAAGGQPRMVQGLEARSMAASPSTSTTGRPMETVAVPQIPATLKLPITSGPSMW
eukprot:s2263_g6.t1